MTNQEIQYQVAKVGGVWAAIGITSWAEAASFLAFVLSFLALAEWLWKKAIKPLMIRLGYIAGPSKDDLR